MADGAAAAQHQPTVEELVAAIKDIKEKNPEFGIKRVHKELKVLLRAWAARAEHGSLDPCLQGVVESPAAVWL